MTELTEYKILDRIERVGLFCYAPVLWSDSADDLIEKMENDNIIICVDNDKRIKNISDTLGEDSIAMMNPAYCYILK